MIINAVSIILLAIAKNSSISKRFLLCLYWLNEKSKDTDTNTVRMIISKKIDGLTEPRVLFLSRIANIKAIITEVISDMINPMVNRNPYLAINHHLIKI